MADTPRLTPYEHETTAPIEGAKTVSHGTWSPHNTAVSIENAGYVPSTDPSPSYTREQIEQRVKELLAHIWEHERRIHALDVVDSKGNTYPEQQKLRASMKVAQADADILRAYAVTLGRSCETCRFKMEAGTMCRLWGANIPPNVSSCAGYAPKESR